jgi:V/A-type H+-transporting ATPase subunit F
MYKGVAVLGDRDSIYGFSSIGINIFPVSGEGEAKEKFRQLCSGEYAVIYVVESIASKIGEEIEKVSGQMSPAVILIPGVYGNTGQGKTNVRKTVEKAVGSDILFKGE